MRRSLLFIIGAFASLLAIYSCHRIDNHRLPVTYVNVAFQSVGVWDIYGVTGAGQHRNFIMSEKKPTGFPYTAMSATGLGGIMLCTTYLGTPVAYDLACPVECRASIRVYINEDNVAECPSCHSQYDVFEKYGYPIAGRAAQEGWGLEVYSVGPGPMGEYMVISK